MSPLLTAELLSIGTEITAGETRDTNAGELAGSLSDEGVRVLRMTALPDDLTAVHEAFDTALGRAHLVVSTGGLGPTPDDLTREAIAAACGETVAVDPELERWLRALWSRRGLPFADMNLKQAWLIPSARAIPNQNGTAPGWWVERPGGRVIVAMPGPPREMRPMWRDAVVPLLRDRGLGQPTAVRTYRLAGIGESAVADLLGEPLLRATNPIVATYARADAVDVRISAVASDGRTAQELLAPAEAIVIDALGDRIWASGETTWADALASELDRLGWDLATHEVGTAGALAALLAGMPRLVHAEIAPRAAGKTEDRAEAARLATGSDVALAVRSRARGGDSAVSVAVAWPGGSHRESRVVFLAGDLGRHRAAVAAAHVLLTTLRGLAVSRPKA